MSYNISDLDYETSSGFGSYEVTVLDAGVGMSKFGPCFLLIVKPTNPKRFEQHLSMGIGKGDYVFAGNPRAIETGRGEKAFTTTIYDEIVSGPKIKVISNGGLFLNMLKHLGFELIGGNLTSCIGLKLDLEEMDANAVIKRFNEEHPKSELPERRGDFAGRITMPVKIIEMPTKKVSLREAVLEVIEGKTEADMEAWYKGTEHYDGSVTALYKVLAVLEKTEVLIINDKYMVKKGDKKDE